MILFSLLIYLNSTLQHLYSSFKAELEKRYTKEVVLIDERLSTTEATNYLLDADMSRKKRKKVIDSVAASIILDTYLKSKGK